jgi:hypothetical protein
MPASARLYLCARCRAQVMICRRCDRGQIHCSPPCAREARRDSIRAAGQRYQQSRPGRFCHARRQRAYRSRRATIASPPPEPLPVSDHKVTHQGSGHGVSRDEVILARDRSCQRVHRSVTRGFRCQFCGEPCSDFLRWRFLRPAERKRSRSSSP